MSTTLVRPRGRCRVAIAALALVVSASFLLGCSDAAEEEGVASIVEATPASTTGLVADDDGDPAVRLATGSTMPVSYGLVVDGLVELIGGVDEGDVVAVPGSR